uniref:ORF116 n=1 Tax=Malaco herpesvirus 1 TaxID=3031797 RepID=A0AA48P7Y3_9VIRU|nr:TPA_asm: ORF116 [Malaco herpesvirus 1]
MAQYVSHRFAPCFKHALEFSCNCPQAPSCELCETAKFIVKYGTGSMLRDLLSFEERRFNGSDAVGVKCGEMTYSMACKIAEEEMTYTPHIMKDEKASVKINIIRLQRMLQDDFPGLDLFEHMEGSDLSVNIGVYVPFLKHSNQLYIVLRDMYKAVITGGDTSVVPKQRQHLFILQCAYISNIIARNPNWLWGLSSITNEVDLLHLITSSSE